MKFTAKQKITNLLFPQIKTDITKFVICWVVTGTLKVKIPDLYHDNYLTRRLWLLAQRSTGNNIFFDSDRQILLSLYILNLWEALRLVRSL